MVETLDITVSGLGVRRFTGAELGTAYPIDLQVPVEDGAHSVALHGIVRTLVDTPDGAGRVGFEFQGLSVAARRALVAHCLYEARQPELSMTQPIAGAGMLTPAPPGRRLVRSLSLAALIVGGGTALAGPVGAVDVDITHTVQTLEDVRTVETAMVKGGVRLTDSTGSPRDGATTEYLQETWVSFGETGSDGCVIGALPAADDLTIRLSYGGLSEERRHNTSANPFVDFRTHAADVTLTTSTGSPLSGGAVHYANGDGSWHEFGTTDETGTATAELLPQPLLFRMIHNGLWNETEHDTSSDPTVRFSTVPVNVSLRTSTGAPIAKGEVFYNATGWRKLGATDETGRMSAEVLSQRTYYLVLWDGLYSLMLTDPGRDPNIDFQTGAVVDATGGTVTEFYSGGWRPFYDGVEILPATVTFRQGEARKFTATPIAGQTIEVPSGAVVTTTTSTTTALTTTTTEPTTTTTAAAPATSAPTTLPTTAAPTTTATSMATSTTTESATAESTTTSVDQTTTSWPSQVSGPPSSNTVISGGGGPDSIDAEPALASPGEDRPSLPALPEAASREPAGSPLDASPPMTTLPTLASNDPDSNGAVRETLPQEASANAARATTARTRAGATSAPDLMARADDVAPPRTGTEGTAPLDEAAQPRIVEGGDPPGMRWVTLAGIGTIAALAAAIIFLSGRHRRDEAATPTPGRSQD